MLGMKLIPTRSTSPRVTSSGIEAGSSPLRQTTHLLYEGDPAEVFALLDAPHH